MVSVTYLGLYLDVLLGIFLFFSLINLSRKKLSHEAQLRMAGCRLVRFLGEHYQVDTWMVDSNGY